MRDDYKENRFFEEVEHDELGMTTEEAARLVMEEAPLGQGNGRLFSSTSCFARHKRPRSQQYVTEREEQKWQSSNRKIDMSERQLQNAVARLFAMGKSPKLTETLEEFVERYSELLEIKEP